jgi:(p)ppGpp synthase/HD superfamily hydrolase
MRLTPQINRAIAAAAYLHRNQTRKGKETPAVSHMFAVMVLLAEHTDDETLLTAALLHDVLEDVPGYGEARMRADFGDAVTELVLEVSEKKDPNEEYDKRGTWRERKEGYLAGLRTHSEPAVLLSAADRVHNLESLNEDLVEHGLGYMENFNAGAADQAWFLDEAARIYTDRLGAEHPLAQRANAAVRRFKELVGV